MRAPIRAICRPEIAPGLALAGLSPLEASDGFAAAAALETLQQTPMAGGLILIEESLHAQLPKPLRRQIRRDGKPILIPFPGPSLGRPRLRAPEEEVVELLRRSIGYRLRLR